VVGVFFNIVSSI